ncbi:hypothetical protein [Peribacillus frigoritolerans]|uniref:hypothetical protein n=1 Tax=Peribacillus frigoritolerans TaxID=450367 RepID=UPI0033827D91
MSDNKVTNNMITSIEGRDLVMERIFDGQRDLVFKAFSNSEHLAGWWGPSGWQTENRAFNFKLTAYGIIACGAQMKTKVNFLAKNLGGKLFIKK